MEIFLAIIIFIFGLCVGSFINMLIYRTAVRYKLKKSKFLISNDKRSFCDECGRQLKWYENVPVISWLVQKGKTRCCGKKLPLSYPIVELLMGIIFVIFNFQFSTNFQIFNVFNLLSYFLGLIIITFLVFSTVFDLKYMILPDFSTIILIILAFIILLFDKSNVIPYLLTALGASLFLLSLYLITKGKGMGMGDVKLALFIGLFLGLPKTVVAFYLAFITGAIVGIILILLKKKTKKSAIAFGPFLIFGTLMAYFFSFEFLLPNF